MTQNLFILGYSAYVHISYIIVVFMTGRTGRRIPCQTPAYSIKEK